MIVPRVVYAPVNAPVATSTTAVPCTLLDPLACAKRPVPPTYVSVPAKTALMPSDVLSPGALYQVLRSRSPFAAVWVVELTMLPSAAKRL